MLLESTYPVPLSAVLCISKNSLEVSLNLLEISAPSFSFHEHCSTSLNDRFCSDKRLKYSVRLY